MLFNLVLLVITPIIAIDDTSIIEINIPREISEVSGDNPLSFTVISTCAVTPFSVLTVKIALPALTPVIFWFSSTVKISGSEDVNVYSIGKDASSGCTITSTLVVSPTFILVFSGLISIDVTSIYTAVTFTVATLSPTFTVIVTVPGFKALTTPFSSIETIDESELSQVTFEVSTLFATTFI